MRYILGQFTAIMLMMFATVVYAENPNKQLMFHFPFDEGEGKMAKDVSSNKLEGTIINADWVDGVVGRSLQFNEGRLYVPGIGMDEPEEMTIEFWFKPTDVILNGDRIDLMYRLHAGGRPHFTFNHNGLFFGCYLATQGYEFVVPSSYRVFYPHWYYFVLTQNKKKAVLYIDGKVDGEVLTGGPARLDIVNNGLSFGGHYSEERSFNGSIDEVKMWNVALTAEEIKKTWDQHTYNKPLLTSANPKVAAMQKQNKVLTAEQKLKNIETCTHNLQEIGKAIQSYYKEHGEYPEFLSDLHPIHLTDANVLICPADKKDGKPLFSQLTDPKKPVSYDYQMHRTNQKNAVDEKTMYGDVAPLIRCWHHYERNFDKILNLNYANKVNQSNLLWNDSLEQLYGSVEKAIETLESGLQKMPDNSRYFGAYLKLINLYLKAERKADAEKIINRFKTVMREDNYWDSFVLADMLEAMNLEDELTTLYLKLAEQHPTNRFVLERIADYHREQGNAELELEYRKKYVPGLKYIGKMVPDFTATDLDGKAVSIEAYRGKVLLLDFWAVWCGPCVAEMPNVKIIYEKYKDKGFDILGISLDNDETRLRNFLIENEIPWRQVFSGKGWDSPLVKKYGIYGIPNMWLIDKEGKLISHQARGDALERMVVEALKEQPVE